MWLRESDELGFLEYQQQLTNSRKLNSQFKNELKIRSLSNLTYPAHLCRIVTLLASATGHRKATGGCDRTRELNRD